MIAHVAGAGRGSFNHRFAQPSRDAQPMSSLFFPTDLFPFTDVPQTDPETGETAGLLDATNKSKTAPKIFYTNTSYEYWGRAAALIHTSADGKKDVEPPANVRIYFLTGLQHFSGAFPPAKSTPGSPEYTAQQLQNPNPIRWYWRALITDMNDWVKDGKTPPASTHTATTAMMIAQVRYGNYLIAKNGTPEERASKASPASTVTELPRAPRCSLLEREFKEVLDALDPLSRKYLEGYAQGLLDRRGRQ